MYIPRPAKLLFQIDYGWGKLLAKHGDAIPEWTQQVVERMLACGTPAMGLRRYCCASSHCTHTKYICYSCKGKGCSACGMKATEQWIAEQQHILPRLRMATHHLHYARQTLASLRQQLGPSRSVIFLRGQYPNEMGQKTWRRNRSVCCPPHLWTTT